MPIPEMALSTVKSLYWEVFPSMATQRVYCTPVLWAGRLYVLGGCSENGLPLDSAEVLDLESQRWCELPPLPTARAGASAVAVGDHLMVMGGMDAQQSPLASVEVYHPDEGKWERKTGLGQASMGTTTLEKGVCSGDSLSSLRPQGRVSIHRDLLLLRRIPPAEPHSGRDRSVQFCLWVHVKTISKTYLDSLAGERSCVRTCGSLTNTSVSPQN
ncbi:hypothetical protein PO909_013861 [Leuciscus waleckii]